MSIQNIMTSRAKSLTQFKYLMAFLACALINVTSAQPLEIKITGGTQGTRPIAIVPFENADSASQNISDIISADLTRSGKFDILSKSRLIGRPSLPNQLNVKDWRLLRQEAVAIGQVIPQSGGYKISYHLFDVITGSVIDTFSIVSTEAQLRSSAHQISDRIYERLTGVPGAFNTRIAYVLTSGKYKNKTYELQISDSDGYGPQTILKSSSPILSPAWTPDASKLAYVTIKNARHQIYLQDLATGSREVLSQYPKINGSPSFSKDGRKMALTLSKDGNSEIYVMDLATKKLTRITKDRAIDTEPSFSPNGREIVFTSDRSGRPQIYKVGIFGGKPQRLTFEGKYNTNASYSPVGDKIVLITYEGNGYRVGLLDQRSGNIRTLSSGNLDESPTYAPNGEMILFAGKRGSTGVLSVVSEFGKRSHELTFRNGDVREPAWSPVRR